MSSRCRRCPDLPLGGGGPDETKKEGGDTKPQVVDQVRAEELLAQQQQLQGEAVAAAAGGLDTRYEERERRRMQGMAALVSRFVLLVAGGPRIQCFLLREKTHPRSLSVNRRESNDRPPPLFTCKPTYFIFQAQNMKDTSILIFQRDPSGGMNPRMSALGKARNPGSGRVRHQLEKREGKVEYKTSASDGLVEICVQSFQAKPDNPSRISIRVIEPMESPSMYEEDLEDKIERQEEEKRKLSMHSSRIAAELDSFQKRMEELAKNADNSKDRELDFHGKSIALNKAVKYWPIFRIVVLVAAGYMQATNVIRYMKSKHIY